MNQIAKDRTREAAKRRREYLTKKGTAYTAAGICGFIASAGFAVATLALLGILCAALNVIGLSDWVFVVIFGLCGLAVGTVGYFGSWHGKTRGDRVPYVPPVAEQLLALPADEVLVRASAEPAAPPEELLRAAQVGMANHAEQLLRVTIDKTT